MSGMGLVLLVIGALGVVLYFMTRGGSSAPVADSADSAAPEGGATPSVYEQIGGEPAVNAAVDIFYGKVLADDSISHFFADTDMEAQAAKQKAFLTMVMGGPNEYTGKDMREAHKDLEGLNDAHFDAVMKHLGDTLAELKVPEHLIATIAGVAESTRDDVLNRGGEELAAPADASVYEQIGGEPAVNAAVDIFYTKVLADDSISHFFADTDMEAQAAKQKAFLTMVMGGPNEYTGKDMREAHKDLKGLNSDHFDAVMKHLGDTLTELNVPEHLIATIAGVAESTRDDVLNR